MQKILEDILNAGIALFRAGEGSISKAVQEVQSTFEELKQKGATDKSEAAVKLRASLDDIATRANNLKDKAGSAYQEGLKQIEKQYENAVEQIKKLVPEEKVNEVKTKIDALRAAIKEKLN